MLRRTRRTVFRENFIWSIKGTWWWTFPLGIVLGLVCK